MPDFGAEAAKGGPVVDVSILPTGWLYLPDTWIFQDGKPGFKHWSPDFSFLVRHPSGRTIIFDLGMRKDLENNPLVIRQDYPTIEPWVPKDACDLLLEGPVHPKDIDAVILSHLHFDHTGDVTKFPSAEIIAGEGTAEATSPGWPTAQLSPFDGTVLTHPKFRELSKSNPGYGSLDVFPYAYDFFSDGSFYLLDAPGHMAGHQIGLARTGEKEWVVMGGDCCHHMDLLVENNRTISVVDGPNGQPGFHKDPKAAQESIEKLKKMRAYKNILTLLAHDASLQGKCPLYPATINGWSIREAQGFGQSRTI